MSECEARTLDEAFVRDFYICELTQEQVALVLAAWEPFRDEIERTLERYWETDDGYGPVSWRDYRNSSFDYLPEPNIFDKA